MAYDSIEHLLLAWFENKGEDIYPGKIGYGDIRDLAERLSGQMAPFRSFFRAHEGFDGYDFKKCLKEAREQERNPDTGFEGLDSGIARLAIAGKSDPPAERPEWVQPNAQVKRKPSGRLCRILKVDDKKAKALIKDLGHAIWVNYTTLERDWALAGA